MSTSKELRILFPTSFSDACFRTIRAVAQLADSCEVKLTIAHVAKEGCPSFAKTRDELQSFFAEASHYGFCRRVLLQGDPVREIAELARRSHFDLVMTPASDRIGFPALLRSSFRARLLRECPTPLWTIGSSLDRVEFRRQIRTVACLIDFESPNLRYARLAEAFASRIGARFRILHVIQPVDEGTLKQFCFSETPLHPDVAIERIRTMMRSTPAGPEIDIAVGGKRRALRQLLESVNADLMFAGPGQAMGYSPFSSQLQSYLNRLPCPVVCLDGAASNFGRWSFEEHGAEREAQAPQQMQLAG